MKINKLMLATIAGFLIAHSSSFSFDVTVQNQTWYGIDGEVSLLCSGSVVSSLQTNSNGHILNPGQWWSSSGYSGAFLGESCPSSVQLRLTGGPNDYFYGSSTTNTMTIDITTLVRNNSNLTVYIQQDGSGIIFLSSDAAGTQKITNIPKPAQPIGTYNPNPAAI